MCVARESHCGRSCKRQFFPPSSETHVSYGGSLLMAAQKPEGQGKLELIDSAQTPDIFSDWAQYFALRDGVVRITLVNLRRNVATQTESLVVIGRLVTTWRVFVKCLGCLGDVELARIEAKDDSPLEVAGRDFTLVCPRCQGSYSYPASAVQMQRLPPAT